MGIARVPANFSSIFSSSDICRTTPPNPLRPRYNNLSGLWWDFGEETHHPDEAACAEPFRVAQPRVSPEPAFPVVELHKDQRPVEAIGSRGSD